MGLRAEKSHFLLCSNERERGELRAPIHKVPLVGFCRAKNKSSSHQRGYEWVSKTLDFAEDPNEEFGKSKVSDLGSVHETS